MRPVSTGSPRFRDLTCWSAFSFPYVLTFRYNLVKWRLEGPPRLQLSRWMRRLGQRLLQILVGRLDVVIASDIVNHGASSPKRRRV